MTWDLTLTNVRSLIARIQAAGTVELVDVPCVFMRYSMLTPVCVALDCVEESLN